MAFSFIGAIAAMELLNSKQTVSEIKNYNQIENLFNFLSWLKKYLTNLKN